MRQTQYNMTDGTQINTFWTKYKVRFIKKEGEIQIKWKDKWNPSFHLYSLLHPPLFSIIALT